jgi:hypothetical protein
MVFEKAVDVQVSVHPKLEACPRFRAVSSEDATRLVRSVPLTPNSETAVAVLHPEFIARLFMGGSSIDMLRAIFPTADVCLAGAHEPARSPNLSVDYSMMETEMKMDREYIGVTDVPSVTFVTEAVRSLVHYHDGSSNTYCGPVYGKQSACDRRDESWVKNDGIDWRPFLCYRSTLLAEHYGSLFNRVPLAEEPTRLLSDTGDNCIWHSLAFEPRWDFYIKAPSAPMGSSSSVPMPQVSTGSPTNATKPEPKPKPEEVSKGTTHRTAILVDESSSSSEEEEEEEEKKKPEDAVAEEISSSSDDEDEERDSEAWMSEGEFVKQRVKAQFGDMVKSSSDEEEETIRLGPMTR